MSDILWEPSPERAAASHLSALMQRNCFASYDALWRFSVEEPAAFWMAVWEDGGVISSKLPDAPFGEVRMPGTEWFPGTRLNFAENLLRRTDDVQYAGADGALRMAHDTPPDHWKRLT